MIYTRIAIKYLPIVYFNGRIIYNYSKTKNKKQKFKKNELKCNGLKVGNPKANIFHNVTRNVRGKKKVHSFRPANTYNKHYVFMKIVRTVIICFVAFFFCFSSLTVYYAFFVCFQDALFFRV